MATEPAEGMEGNGGSRPVPDPTVLTTALVEKAMTAEKDRVDGLVAAFDQRLRGDDRATQLRLQRLDEMPDRIDEKVGHLTELLTVQLERIEQQFNIELKRIAQQFEERDVRSERESRDNKVAVDAAFAAQKEAAAKQDESNQKAIDKSEKATADAILKLGELFDTTNRAQVDKITALNQRMDRFESLAIGQTVGTAQQQQQQISSRNLFFAAAGLLLTIIAIGSAILAASGR